MGEEQAVKSLLPHSEVAKMRLQVRGTFLGDDCGTRPVELAG